MTSLTASSTRITIPLFGAKLTMTESSTANYAAPTWVPAQFFMGSMLRNLPDGNESGDELGYDESQVRAGEMSSLSGRTKPIEEATKELRRAIEDELRHDSD